MSYSLFIQATSSYVQRPRCLCSKEPSPNARGKALRSLDSYFEKLQGTASSKQQHPVQETKPKPSADPKIDPREAEYALKEELLLSVLKEFEAVESAALSDDKPDSASPGPGSDLSSASPGAAGPADDQSPSMFVDAKTGQLLVQPGSFIISLLVGINVGVYLFGFASSQQTANSVDLAFSAGAKVNDLIINGEWWRLVTPIFLHSGLLHIILSSWALLCFGPEVEALYGSLGFLVIYFAGGSIGNVVSFLETPAVSTVGGTGPVFAVACSWLAFVLKNRSVVRAPYALQRLVMFAGLNLVLGNSLPIDTWTHVGAALAGLLFGFVGSPWYQLDEQGTQAESKDDQDAKEDRMFLFLCCGIVACFWYSIKLQSSY